MHERLLLCSMHVLQLLVVFLRVSAENARLQNEQGTHMIHATPQYFTHTDLHQLTIQPNHAGVYELCIGTQPLTTTEGHPIIHHSYHLIDAIRREAWMRGQLTVNQCGLFGLYCTHHDTIIPGHDGIPRHLTDIFHHHEALFCRHSGPAGLDQWRAWQSVVDWLDAANHTLPIHAASRDATFDQFVMESYYAISTAQQAVVSYLFHQHTTSLLLPLMLAMGRTTPDLYAHGMCLTTVVLPVAGIHTWDEYRQCYNHFVAGAQYAQEYLWLVVQ